MDNRIIDFLGKQKVATICCVNEDNLPHCFSCFYVFDEEAKLLYFKSSVNTQHGSLLKKLPKVAGTIQPDKLNPLAIKGIQFTGTLLDQNDAAAHDARNRYHKKYPFALAMPGEVWTVQLEKVKMTDNTFSFGKKILWQLDDVLAEGPVK